MTLPFRGCPIAILVYHSINPKPDDYSLSPARFLEQIAMVKRHYPVVALRDIRSALADTTTRKVTITFDDALSDFVEHAYPVLVEFNVPASLFVPTGFVGRSNLWDSHLPNVTPKPIMDAKALRQISDGGLVELGSHTVDHLRMRGLPRKEMQVQAANSKTWLEDTCGKAVTTFSYPYGQRDDFSSTSEEVLAEAGYETAVTTCWGTRNSPRNLLALKRIHFSEHDEVSTVRAKIDGWYDWKALKERAGFLSRTGLRMLRAGG